MPLLGDGYKIIADKFQEEATKIRLIGISIPNTYAGFVGIYNTLSDLETAYPPQSQDSTTLAGVRTSADNEFQYYIVSTAGTEIKYWLRIQNVYPLRGDTHDQLSNEGFYQSPLQNTTFTATTVTSANTSGTPLQLSQPFVFSLSALPANTVGVIMQGIRFEDDSNNDIYDWGFGTDKWAGFTEPGEFIVSSWNFKLGGFPTPTP
jgi:hypothetical protein